ncbi:MAG: hypothetical protein JOY79_04890, partial [Acidobacteriaceae bacterium]|nr:hypothetical protein [Acidobacteriaceae bacterium]
CSRLIDRYFPGLSPEREQHMVGVFERARANGNAWFAGLQFSNEREFMMAFRDLLFAYCRDTAPAPAPQLSLDQFRDIVKDLAFVEREVLWLIIKGYSQQQIPPILMNAAATAEAVKKIADERLARVIAGASPEAFSASARSLMEAAESMATEQCVSLKTFNNIVNGQITWREREIAEEHMADCFHCIDRFTTFLGMVRLRKDVCRMEEDQRSRILTRLGFAAAKPKGMLAKIFSRA